MSAGRSRWVGEAGWEVAEKLPSRTAYLRAKAPAQMKNLWHG